MRRNKNSIREKIEISYIINTAIRANAAFNSLNRYIMFLETIQDVVLVFRMSWIDYNCRRAFEECYGCSCGSLSCSFIAMEYPSLRTITL